MKEELKTIRSKIVGTLATPTIRICEPIPCHRCQKIVEELIVCRKLCVWFSPEGQGNVVDLIREELKIPW